MLWWREIFFWRNGRALGLRTAKEELQRLKPLGFGAAHVVDEATTHKDSHGLTLTL